MKNTQKIAVVGGGWYGCHIAVQLLATGFEVFLYEAEDRIFSKASGHNQFRLHQGFHYPRSKLTRYQSSQGFHRFVQHYPDFSLPTPGGNLYLVPHLETVLDFETFIDIMNSSGLSFETVEEVPLGLNGIEGAVSVQERVLNTSTAIQYFSDALGSRIRFGHQVKQVKQSRTHLSIDGTPFDWVIDATWGHLEQDKNVYFEPTLLLYLDPKGFEDALTLVDGDLWSLYPTEEDKVFTLSQVGHTRLGRFSSPAEANQLLRSITTAEVAWISAKMLDSVAEHFPGIRDMEQIGHQLSMKSKKVSRSDSRASSFQVSGRKISVFSGKIDAVFSVTDAIVETITSSALPVSGYVR